MNLLYVIPWSRPHLIFLSLAEVELPPSHRTYEYNSHDQNSNCHAYSQVAYQITDNHRFFQHFPTHSYFIIFHHHIPHHSPPPMQMLAPLEGTNHVSDSWNRMSDQHGISRPHDVVHQQEKPDPIKWVLDPLPSITRTASFVAYLLRVMSLSNELGISSISIFNSSPPTINIHDYVLRWDDAVIAISQITFCSISNYFLSNFSGFFFFSFF